jgi:hypothetical protein
MAVSRRGSSIALSPIHEAAKHSNSFPEPRLRRIRPFSGTAQFCQLILEWELHDPELLQLQRNKLMPRRTR